MIRPPILPQDQGGGYEGMGPAFTGEPIGTRMSTPAGRQAELANLANAAGFFINPLGMMANYVLTGQSPAMQFGIGDQREALGLQQSDVMPQGLMPQGGMSGMFGGLRDFLFGPPQQSEPLGPMAPAVDSRAGISSFENAYNLGLQYGLGEEASNAAGSAAASLVARGVDPITAVTLAMQNASMAATQMDMAGSPFGQPAAQPAAPQFAPQGLSPAAMAQMVSGAADMYGRPISADAVAVNAIGGGGQIGVSPDFVEQSSAADNYGVMGFSGGGQSPSEFSFDDASSGAYGYF
jgi:hypothetical protein